MDIHPMIVELAGDHYEMGKQHGQKLFAYRAAISDLIEAHRNRVRIYSPETLTGMRKEVRDPLSVHSPQTLEMIDGIADGFSLSQDDLFSMMVGSYYEDKLTPGKREDLRETGCTTWAYSEQTGEGERILLAKNRDYLLSHRRLQVVFRCKPSRGNEYFSVNSIGACNVFSSGINREGLAIADTRVPSSDAGPGLPRYSLMMHILENFSYVDEALDYLKSVPRMGGGNLILADVEGRIGSAEVGFQHLDLLRSDQGHLVCTNHFEGPSMQRHYRQADERKKEDSRWRSGEVARRLAQWGGGINIDQAKELMATHGKEFSICVHKGLPSSENTSTLSSALFLPLKRGFYYNEGFPCTTPYQWISFNPTGRNAIR